MMPMYKPMATSSRISSTPVHHPSGEAGTMLPDHLHEITGSVPVMEEHRKLEALREAKVPLEGRFVVTNSEFLHR